MKSLEARWICCRIILELTTPMHSSPSEGHSQGSQWSYTSNPSLKIAECVSVARKERLEKNPHLKRPVFQYLMNFLSKPSTIAIYHGTLSSVGECSN